MSEKSEGLPPVVTEAAHRFYDFLNLRDEPRAAQVIFILGGSSLKPVEKALELYRAGFAPRIAFVSQGGKFGGEAAWGMPEEQKYRETLLAAGVPESAIISERDLKKQTKNTKDEAQYALRFLREHGVDPKEIILVSRPLHQRRAYATFAQQHPDVNYINCPADEPLNLTDTEEVFRLVQEAERLLDYGVKKSDIKKPQIPTSLLKDAIHIRRYLKSTKAYTPRSKPVKSSPNAA